MEYTFDETNDASADCLPALIRHGMRLLRYLKTYLKMRAACLRLAAKIGRHIRTRYRGTEHAQGILALSPRVQRVVINTRRGTAAGGGNYFGSDILDFSRATDWPRLSQASGRAR